MAENQIRYDVDGYEAVTNALLFLLNNYPGLYPDERVEFATLSEDGGVAIFPGNGAAIQNERVDITDHVTQTCAYPFAIVFRTGGLTASRRASLKEWLDTVGRWLEKQPVHVNGKYDIIAVYPPLTGGREITNITRVSPSYLDNKNDDGVEDWVINMTVSYKNEYDR